MKALVLYDSFFGNTEKVANVVAEALCEQLGAEQVKVMRIANLDVKELEGADLVVVGSPTRAFKHSDATKAFLNTIPAEALAGKKVAAFDTRMSVKDVNNAFLTFFAGIFGYAAEKIGKELVKKGGTQACAPGGFIVVASEGPLKDGEMERAATWGKSLAG